MGNSERRFGSDWLDRTTSAVSYGVEPVSGGDHDNVVQYEEPVVITTDSQENPRTTFLQSMSWEAHDRNWHPALDD